MLKGRVAVVTGAGRGLGRAYARAMAAEGAAVVVNDIDAGVAEETVKLIAEAGGLAIAEAGAIGEAETADALVARAVEEFGKLDVMCTNAGVLRDRTLRNTSDEDFDLVLRTHLRGTFTEVATAVRDGGWTPETIAAIFPSVFEPRLQDYTLPPPPGASATPEKKKAGQ